MRTFFSSFLLFFTLTSFALVSEPSPLSLFMIKLTNVTSLAADFKQVVSQGEEIIQKNSGKLFFQRPLNFRWKENLPSTQLIVSNGKLIWVYDEDLEQVTLKKVDTKKNNTPIFLLNADKIRLENDFIITYKKVKNKEHFLLKPKQLKTSSYLWVQLTYRKNKLIELLFEDNLSQITRLSLSKVNLNTKLSLTLFNFVVPKGVDVVK